MQAYEQNGGDLRCASRGYRAAAWLVSCAMLTGSVLPGQAWAQGKKTGPVATAKAPKPGAKAPKPAAKAPKGVPATPAPAAEPPKPATPTTGVAIDKANWKQKQAATRAYKKGVAAMARKSPAAYEEALVAFRQSYGTVASPNSRLMVVRALAALERRPDAYAEALVVVVEAKAAAAKNPKKYTRTLEAAEGKLAELKKTIALLTVTVATAEEGVTLSVAGKSVERSRWGREAIALNPGTIEVVLSTAAGNETKQVELTAGSAKKLSIAPPQPDTTLLPPPPPPPVSAGYTGPDRRLMAYIAGGVGGLGILTFGIFGLLSSSKYSRLESGCETMVNCDPSLVDVANSGKTLQVVANVGLAFGLIGLAAGGGLFVWDVVDPAAEEDGGVAPKVSVGPGSMIISGRF